MLQEIPKVADERAQFGVSNLRGVLAVELLVERIFAICLHVSLSVMVLYALAYRRPIWFWGALLWHAFVDAVAVYVGQKIGILQVEGLVAVFAVISLWIVFMLRPKFNQDAIDKNQVVSSA